MSSPQKPLNINKVKFSGAIRIVPGNHGHTLEVYHNPQEAVSSGVSKEIAAKVFSDIKVAWCWAHVDKEFKLVRCEKRSLDGETCKGECHLFADGEDLGTGTQPFQEGVTYMCKCIG